MKFRMLLNESIVLDMFLHTVDDFDILEQINDPKNKGKEKTLAFQYLKRRLKGNYGKIRPVGFVA